MCTFLLFVSSACFAQSWTRADQIGVGRVKHWDDIKNTSTSAQLLESISPSEPAAPAPAAAGSTAPFFERRQLPDAGALKDWFQQVLATKDDKVCKAAGLRLQLPDSGKWFSDTFGSETAVGLEREYGALRAGWTKQFDSLLKGLRGRGETVVAVQVIRGAGDPDATPGQRQALAAMQQPTSLYTVRFINPQTRDQYIMHSFAYVDGAFRFVGRLSALAQPQQTRPEQ